MAQGWQWGIAVISQILCVLGGAGVAAAAATAYIARARAECARARAERDEALRANEEKHLLDQRTAQAQKMEAVGRLAGGIAHDFNNLLTAITGYSELLITNMTAGDVRLQDAYEIRRAALSAARLTTQLLAFSRGQRARIEVLDVNAVVARTSALLKRTLGDDVILTLELDRGIQFVKADRGHLEQVVMNLAINARDAMASGGSLVLRTSNHRCAAGDDHVRLTVTDTGCGMSEEVQSKIFEPFFSTKGSAGTGLGLATVYGIVEQNGGSINVSSTEGVGTTFTIDLPATDEPMATPEASAPPRVVDGCARVLLVEDDARVRSLAELVLRRAGHDVCTARGPHEALATLQAHPDIDVVLTDVVMPEMNGFDLASEVRRIAPATRIIFMSGFASDHFKQPIDDPFLAKPFTVESLTHVVEQVLATAA